MKLVSLILYIRACITCFSVFQSEFFIRIIDIAEVMRVFTFGAVLSVANLMLSFAGKMSIESIIQALLFGN